MSNNEIVLHLSLIPSVGPVLIQKVLKGFAGNLSAMYQSSVADLQQRCFISEQNAHAVLKGLSNKDLLERELSLLSKYNYHYLSIQDEQYPALLKEIHAPPAILYYWGTLPDTKDRVLAVVGSRQADSYGQRVIEMLVPDLVRNGLRIVSGGARGADAMAHEAALRAQGKTYAIIGSGLLEPYPSVNKKLFERIAQSGGAVMSPFSLETKPLPGNFPARNRIIAGMSLGTVVIQAAESSGAAITAFFALEQGREVFAVPGRVDSELSVGCHKLLQQGATLVGGVEDILPQLGAHITIERQNNNDTVAPSFKVVPATAHNPYPHDSLEYAIFNRCQMPVSFDELMHVTQVDVATLQNMLVDLQLQGLIEQKLGGLWAAL